MSDYGRQGTSYDPRAVGHELAGRVAGLTAIARAQHNQALEKVIADHTLWTPRIVSFQTRPCDNVIELNDGRAFLVRTKAEWRDNHLTYTTTTEELK